MKANNLTKLIIGILGLATATATMAAEVKVVTELANPFLASDIRQNTFLKVGLTGGKMNKKKKHAPVNVAIVLDRSGSMSGSKMQQAKIAAKAAVDRLGKQDILSVITYNHEVTVLVPATKVRNKQAIKRKIDALESNGNTALHGGVVAAGAELQKFIDKNRVNRMILLSDGLANVGPSSPEELAQLGQKLGKDRISVSTIGLGDYYNEELMAQLASTSDGSHAFVKNEEDLPRIFNAEFGDVLSVVAQEVSVTIVCHPGIRPVRVLGRTAEINGQTITLHLNQLYSEQEKYVLLEVDVPPGKADTVSQIARVDVSYTDMEHHERINLASQVSVRFTDSKEQINTRVNKKVMASCVSHIANDNIRRAMQQKDQGNDKEARETLQQNRAYIADNVELDEESLQEYQKFNDKNIEELESGSVARWNSNKKEVQDEFYRIEKQRGYKHK